MVDRPDPAHPLPTCLRVDVAADPVRVVLIRRAVEVWLKAVGWPRPATEPLIFAINEVVSNSIEHAYRDLDAGRIVVDVEIVASRVAVAGRRCVRACATVADFGRWRGGRPAPGRGNGLALVRAVAESVDVDTGDGGTRVTVHMTPVA